jgi:hypothetical protein
MNPSFNVIAVTLVAGVIAGSMTACSKDLPTGPAEKAQAGASLKAAPPNDDLRNAVVIAALPFTHNVNTSEAKTSHGDPLGFENCDIGGHTVWYQFSPTENIRVNANTVGSDYDPVFGVYTGRRGDLTQVTCNFLPASATFEAIAGETYLLVVGSSDGQPGGNLIFNVDVGLEVGVTIDPEGSVNPSTGVATISGTVTCSRTAFFELAGSVQQRKVFVPQGGLFTQGGCDGVTRWEAEAVPESGRFGAGTAEVSAGALFTADASTEERHGQASATVRLRVRQ